MPKKEFKGNWVARLTEFFIGNTQLTVLLGLLIVLAGVFSFNNLRREGFPQVPVKIVVVNTVYKGAASSEIERVVTGPIEASLEDVSSIKELSSTSGDNFSSVTATLESDADLQGALQDITTKVTATDLPKEVEKPTVTQPATGQSAFSVAITGIADSKMLLEQGRIFEREVSQVKGVKRVKTDVDVAQTLAVNVDTTKAASLGVDLGSLTTTLQAANVTFPAGIITTGQTSTNVVLNGRLRTSDDLRAVIVSSAGLPIVRLSDIASIVEEFDDKGKIVRVGYQKDGKLTSSTGITYSIDIRDDADILHVNEELEKAIIRLKDDHILASNIETVRVYDEAVATERQIHELRAGAFGEKWEGLGLFGYVGIFFGGIWLLALAMALFINVRAAIVAALSIPLSFLVTVITLYSFGITLNTLTLFSMVLVLGLVVDPVIVVLEALQRYKDRGYKGIEAAKRAVDSVGLGVLMAVLISTIVFTPFGIVSGVFGQIIRYIPITVIPALIASFFIPVLFLTALGNWILKSHPHGDKNDEEASLWRVSLWFKLTNRYILDRVSAQIGVIIVAFTLPIVAIVATFGTGAIKSVQFSQPEDSPQILTTISYPANYSSGATEDLAKKAEAVLNDYPEISNYYYFQQQKGQFMILVNLADAKERSRNATVIAKDISGKLPKDDKTIFATADLLSAGPPAQAFPVQLQIYDADLVKLDAFRRGARDYLNNRDDVVRVADGTSDVSPNISISPKRDELALLGLSPATLGGIIASKTTDKEVTKIDVAGESTSVLLRSNTAPASIEDVKSVPVGSLKTSSLSEVSETPGEGPISHFNGNRYITISAGVKEGVDAAKVQSELGVWANDNRQKYGLRSDAFTSKGEGDEIVKSFGELFTALGAAILLTYVALVLFFRSFLQPLIITFAVPLAFIGAFPALVWFGGGQFGFLEILGLITLVGIVENVGIFVIDYANRRVKEGMHPKDAIALATAVRFRPIFLTKICALGSLLPLAVLSPFWRGLSVVIVAGILTSGITSLFTTPILYHWVEKIRGFRLRRGKAA